MSKASERVKEYYKLYPWKKHLQYSRQRSRMKGWANTLTVQEVHHLWIRDAASKMERPSIDRINPKLGYCFANCRFLELVENIRLGSIGRDISDKRREASRQNLKKWHREGGIPWNKGDKPARIPCAFCGMEFQPKRNGRVMCSYTCTAKNARRKQLQAIK